jgi:hypothetical protein
MVYLSITHLTIQNNMLKVADINISEDNCGLYVIKLYGNDAIYFQVIDKSLYFLLTEPNICKNLYKVTISVEDLAGRFTPKVTSYSLNTYNCICTSTTTSTTPSPTTTSTSTTIAPFVYPSNIVSTNAIYTQSSVWSENTFATALGMNNQIASESFQTGTNLGTSEWIKMELNAIYNIKNIVVGCDFNNTLRFGWGKSYTENLLIQYSLDNFTWVNAANTGIFITPMKVYPVNFNARYIRLTNSNKGNTWMAATEFAAGI